MQDCWNLILLTAQESETGSKFDAHRCSSKISCGVLGLPSLKTSRAIFFIENEAAARRTGRNSLPRSVRAYSTLTGDSDTILLLTTPNFSSSRNRSVSTFGVMPSMFSRKRLNCVVPLINSLMTRIAHFFPMILNVVSTGHVFSSGIS